MRRIPLIALLVITCLALPGCAFRPEVENQAYVLALGIERREDGQLALTARVPKIGQGGKGDEQGGTSTYQTFFASGEAWTDALENLQWVTPRELNLSHLKLLVVSESLAAEPAFVQLIREIAETPHLYTTAHFAVCGGEVHAFVETLQPVIGTRLSSDIDAAMRHYAAHGYIPESLFAEVYCAAGSFYSDPVAARCFQGGEAETKEAARIVVPEADEADGPVESSQRFAGCAVFRRGVLALTLGMRETQLLGLVLGNADDLELDRDGVPCALHLESKPSLKVDLFEDSTAVRLGLRLSCLDSLEADEAQALAERLEDEYEALLRKCQAAGVEPFGFAQAAARCFLTNAEWTLFDWPSRFTRARLEVEVAVIPAV